MNLGWPRKCLVCAALTGTSVPLMREQMEVAKTNGADIVELRVDHIQGFLASRDLHQLLQNRPLPAIVTYRPSWEGGQYEGDESERLQGLAVAIKLGAEFIDVELEVAEKFIRESVLPRRTSSGSKTETRIIVSNHNYKFTPTEEKLAELVAKIQATGADVVKFATTATDISDNARIFRLLSRVQVPLIALVMGPKGQISRLLAPKFGAFLTFGSLGAGQESAPGQPTVAELASIYRLGTKNSGTKIFGLIGNPVAQSKGPILHNLVMEEAGFNGIYVPFLVDDVASFLATFESSDFAGFSVTIPHKLTALKCCDEVDPLVEKIGAVNTLIRRQDGKFVGYNTDCEAAIRAIEEGLSRKEGDFANSKGESPLAGRAVLVVGAGGAGRALAVGAKARGAVVFIANRSQDKAQALAAEIGCQALPMDVLKNSLELNRILLQSSAVNSGSSKGKAVAVLANSTSVGMFPNENETPVPKDALDCFSLVFDAVYNPMETRLLQEAREAGAEVVSGVEMFVGQAALQFHLFTGLPAPISRMRQIVLESLQK